MHKKWIVTSLFLAAIASVLTVYIISLLKNFVDGALVQKQWGAVLHFCVLFVGLFFFEGICTYFHRIFLRTAIERMVVALRSELFSKLLVLSSAQAQRYTSGTAVNFIMNDVFVVSFGLQVVADLFRQPITLLALTGYLFFLNWQLSLICCFALPLVGLIGKYAGGSARRNQSRIQNKLEHISNHIIESVGGLKFAHSYGQTRKLGDEFSHHVDESYKHLMKLNLVDEVVGPLTKWITTCAGALLIGVGAYFVIQGNLTAGALVAYITAAGGIQNPLRQLNQINVRLQTVYAAAERLVGFLQTPLDTIGLEQAKSLRAQVSFGGIPFVPNAAKLSFENVGFRYSDRSTGAGGSLLAVDGIQFSLEPGKKLALVGPSGAGKSTLSYLAMRFLDPSSGFVKLNGQSATDWDLAQFRSYFSYVSQDVFLFNRSIRENLEIARAGCSESQLWDALEKASIRSFVEGLPQKLDTPLGERAAFLSGGERQRISIARAFLRNAPILVLDEATSQLDSANEALVQSALAGLMQNRSVMVIAHRLATIRNVDEVVVLRDGRIVERGRPSELLTTSGVFSELWQAQHSPSV